MFGEYRGEGVFVHRWMSMCRLVVDAVEPRRYNHSIQGVSQANGTKRLWWDDMSLSPLSLRPLISSTEDAVYRDRWL